MLDKEKLPYGPYKKRDHTAVPRPGVCPLCGSDSKESSCEHCWQLCSDPWSQYLPPATRAASVLPQTDASRFQGGIMKRKQKIRHCIAIAPSYTIFVTFLPILVKEAPALELGKRHVPPIHSTLPTLNAHSACVLPVVPLHCQPFR